MLTGKGNAKQQLISHQTSSNQQSADQGLMISSSVPEEPTGETDCSTNMSYPKIINNKLFLELHSI